MRIGIFGGTFNPIHLGHIYIADQTRQQLSLDQVVFLPSGDPPHKSAETLAPAHHRLEMVRLALEGHDHFLLSEREASSTEKSYTIHTLSRIKEEMPGELWFMVGLDAFQEIASWKSADELLSLTNFVVLSRPAHSFLTLTSIPFLPSIPYKHLQALESGTLDRLDIPTSQTTILTILLFPPCHISASAIREQIGQGHEVSDWLPPTVESYIIQHHIYGAKRGNTSSKT